jgi:hypothetical protein
MVTNKGETHMYAIIGLLRVPCEFVWSNTEHKTRTLKNQHKDRRSNAQQPHAYTDRSVLSDLIPCVEMSLAPFVGI